MMTAPIPPFEVRPSLERPERDVSRQVEGMQRVRAAAVVGEADPVVQVAEEPGRRLRAEVDPDVGQDGRVLGGAFGLPQVPETNEQYGGSRKS